MGCFDYRGLLQVQGYHLAGSKLRFAQPDQVLRRLEGYLESGGDGQHHLDWYYLSVSHEEALLTPT
jgi:hypothetical protein